MVWYGMVWYVYIDLQVGTQQPSNNHQIYGQISELNGDFVRWETS